jgi:hypothetical protein
MSKYIFLIIIIILALGLPLFYNMFNSIKMIEKYTGYDITSNPGLGDDQGKYTFSQTSVLVEDIYPLTGRNGISNNGASNIWWHYPIFELGSYDQITNNLRYSDNPDEGTCMPASMCGSLYKEKHLGTNYVKPLPPINPECGTRVGYFTTDINLLPFRTDVPNILY